MTCCCQPTSGSGSGGSGPIQTVCCPANEPQPQTLFATISNVSGCSCLAGTYQLNYIGNNFWISAIIVLCGTSNTQLAFICNTTLDAWQFSINCVNNTFVQNVSSFNCTTSTFTFNGMSITAAGGGLCGFCNGTINVTITP